MNDATVKIGAIVPLSGAGGLSGPSCCNCFRMAAEELNAAGGILGKRVDLVFIDSGQQPLDVANTVRSFMDHGVVNALVGMHDSDVRAAIIETGTLTVPYIYTPTYEGGESAEGVFYLGETPQQQLGPILPWLMTNRGILSWYFIGNDYSWPRKSHMLARRFIEAEGGKVVADHYVPFDTEDFSDYIEDIASVGPDAILISLVGRDSATFNRAFANAGLSRIIQRYGPLIEENTLYAIGEAGGENLYTSGHYFQAIMDSGNRRFLQNYTASFGADAPVVTGLAQSCYEGVQFLAALTTRAGSFDPDQVTAAAEGYVYDGLCGPMAVEGRHLVKTIRLAAADGFEFKILEDFKDVAPK